MKISVCLATSGAALALAAGPLNKRLVVHTEVVTDVVYVTVTEGASSKSVFRGGIQSTTTTVVVAPTTSSPPPPPPPPPAPEVVQQTPHPEPTPEVEAVQQQAPPAQEKTQAAAAAPSDFASTAVYHHNIHRENNSAPAIEWSATYAGYAAQTAKKCKFEHDLTPGGGGYGQNLAMWGSSADPAALGASKAIARAISNMWYNGEIGLYDASNYGKDNPDFSNFEQYGHYTQVVWSGSTQVGCEAYFCKPGTMFPDMGAWFSVCNYYPPGNMGGQYGNNVLKPLGRQTITAS